MRHPHMDATAHVDKAANSFSAKSALRVWNSQNSINFNMLYLTHVAHILQRIRWITSATF
jgi:hypothetical protein